MRAQMSAPSQYRLEVGGHVVAEQYGKGKAGYESAAEKDKKKPPRLHAAQQGIELYSPQRIKRTLKRGAELGDTPPALSRILVFSSTTARRRPPYRRGIK